MKTPQEVDKAYEKMVNAYEEPSCDDMQQGGFKINKQI